MAQIQERATGRFEYLVQVPERPVHRHRPHELQAFLEIMGATGKGYELVSFEWEMTTDRLLYGVFRRTVNA